MWRNSLRFFRHIGSAAFTARCTPVATRTVAHLTVLLNAITRTYGTVPALRKAAEPLYAILQRFYQYQESRELINERLPRKRRQIRNRSFPITEAIEQ